MWPVIVEAMREHDQVTRRLNAELRKPTKPAKF
jgi:hypothetical protein